MAGDCYPNTGCVGEYIPLLAVRESLTVSNIVSNMTCYVRGSLATREDLQIPYVVVVNLLTLAMLMALRIRSPWQHIWTFATYGLLLLNIVLNIHVGSIKVGQP